MNYKLFTMGEVDVNILTFPGHKNGVFRVNIKSSDDILALLMAVDAYKREYRQKPYRLVMPYVPYGRQDRVMKNGEALGIKVFADLINSCGFESVVITDPHSDVTSALIDNVVVVEQHTLLKQFKLHNLLPENPILVSPDGGALKKIVKAAETLDTDYICANKRRTALGVNVTIGQEEVFKYPGDRTFLIVDDICDGGRTFVSLAKEIREYTDKPIHLFVSHGIFSYGLSELNTYIDKIYVANDINNTEGIVCLPY